MMRVSIARLYLALNVCCLIRLSAGEIPGPKQNHPIALVGGTIHPVSGPVLGHGTILFEKGKITAMGSTVILPPGTEQISVEGKHVYPGLFDAQSTLGLTEIGAVRATNDFSETGSINSNIRAEVGINPESELIPVTRANGVTVALTMPLGGVISGTAAAIMMDGWTWEEMTLKAPVGMVISWPSMTINRASWERRSEEDQRKTRETQINDLKNAFRDARAYLRAKASEGRDGVPAHPGDVRWEAMAPVLERKIPVLMNAEEIQQIQAAVAWAEEEQVKLVLLGGYDTWRVADLLKAKDIPVIVNPIHRTPWRRSEPYDDPFALPKKLFDAGVRFCIAGEAGASNERNLPYHAATAAAFGLPREEALRAITLLPAQILGLADRIGSLEPGKDATLIVTNGDPLEITTSVEMEFIQGSRVALTNKQTHLHDKYLEKYRREGLIK